MTKRKLTNKEIENILEVLQPPRGLPQDVQNSLKNKYRKDIHSQLLEIEIYPEMIPKLKRQITRQFHKTLIQPGENVGVLTAQSIGERQTQMTLNTFHSAGMAIATVVTGVPRFSELLNATKNPKSEACTLHFKSHNTTLPELRTHINHHIREFKLKDIVTSQQVFENPEAEPWYSIFCDVYDKNFEDIKNTHQFMISFSIDREKMYKYDLSLSQISNVVEFEYDDLTCIFSTAKDHRIDVFVDISNIDLPEDYQSFITTSNKYTIYLENVVIPMLHDLHVCGIPGITDFYYHRDDNGKWCVDTIGGNLTEILACPLIRAETAIPNNMWEIYEVLGIEAVREFLIAEYMNVVSSDGTFINERHVSLLVDMMTHTGVINSISRYGMKKANVGVLSKASFEECLDNFLKAGINGEVESTTGVSASIMCGKRSMAGTGLCKLVPDISMFLHEETVGEKTEFSEEEILEEDEIPNDLQEKLDFLDF
jgi:DNA-directed RNA polymerase II subunit RPB1